METTTLKDVLEVTAVLDVQGFAYRGQYYVAELSLATEYASVTHILDTQMLPDNLYETLHVHGLRTSPSITSQEAVVSLIRKLLLDVEGRIGVRNNQLAKLLRENNIEYVDLERFTPSIEIISNQYKDTYYQCFRHTFKTNACAVSKASKLLRWLQELKLSTSRAASTSDEAST